MYLRILFVKIICSMFERNHRVSDISEETSIYYIF